MKEVVKKEMDRTLDSVWNGYRLCILRDINGWIGDRTRAGITGAFEVPGDDSNGIRAWSPAQKRDSVWVTYFKHRSVHKYTRVAEGRESVEIKSMIDLMMVKKAMRRYVQDVRPVRGMGRGLSDHHVVLCKSRLVGAWIKRRGVLVWAKRIRSEKLREHQYR